MIDRKTTFDSIAQRILYGLVFSYSDDSFIENASEVEWYNIMKHMLFRVYEDPSLLGLPVDLDDSFRLHQCNNEKPELIKIYKKSMKVITNFYKFLYYTGLYGVIENDVLTIDRSVFNEYKVVIKDSFLELLGAEGIVYNKSKESISFESVSVIAWKLLSETVTSFDDNMTRAFDVKLFKFACCVFSNDLSYWIRKVEKLNDLESGFFKKYEKILLDKGYEKQMDIEFNHNSLIISHQYVSKVSGFSVSYHFHRVEQFYFSVLNSIGAKAILEDFHKMKDNIKVYLMMSCRRCNGCNRCTKGGKYKRMAVDVVFNDEQISLCPDFPNKEWLSVNDVQMSTIIDYIELQNIYGTQWRK